MHIDREGDRTWAAEWIEGRLLHEGVSISPDDKTAIWSALGSLVGSRVPRRIGAYKALPLFALCDLLALGVLFGVVMFESGANALIAAALLVVLMMGASAGRVYGLMMQHTRPGLSALDYGIQSSLFVIGRTVIPMLAGVMLDWGGYGAMLGSLMLGLALVLLVCIARLRTFTSTSKTV